MSVPGRKASQLSASLSAVSEEVFEFYCHPCSQEGQHLETHGYCVDCHHHLCAPCYKYHCRPLPFKNHVLLDKTSMPKMKLPAKSKDKCTDICPNHQGRIVEYVCEQHECFGCSVCMTTGHRRCDDVTFIPDIASSAASKREYSEMQMALNGFSNGFHDNLRKSKENIPVFDRVHSQAIDCIRDFRKKINSFFDELENKIIAKANKFKGDNTKVINMVTDTGNTMIQEIEKLTSDLDKLHQSDQNCQLFAEMKNAKSKLQAYKDSLIKIETENTLKKYRFKPENKLAELMKSIDSIGELYMIKDTTKNKATPVGEFNVKQNSDSQVCFISECIVLTSGQLVLADKWNMKVKLFNTKQSDFITGLLLPSNPFGVTEVNECQIAVTMPGQQKIQLINVSDSLSLDREIKVDGGCFGIVCNKQRLIVSFIDPSKIQMLCFQGRVLQNIATDDNGDQLYIAPYYIALNPDQTTLYVSDKDKHTVTSLTMDGKVTSVYKNDDLKGPTGLTVAADGTVFVCGKEYHNIHQLTADCNKIRVVLSREDGVIYPHPLSISYCDRDDRVYVCNISKGNGNMIKVFQF